MCFATVLVVVVNIAVALSHNLCYPHSAAAAAAAVLRYIVVGDGLEEQAAADIMNWPFVKLTHTNRKQQEVAAALKEQRAGAKDAAAEKVVAAAAAAASGDSETAAKKLRLTADVDVDHAGADGVTAGDGGHSRPQGDIDGAREQQKQQQAPGSSGLSQDDKEDDEDVDVDDDDDDDDEGSEGGDTAQQSKQQQQQGEGLAQRPADHSVHAPGAAGVGVDALQSSGHTLLELTADKLMQLALSIR